MPISRTNTCMTNPLAEHCRVRGGTEWCGMGAHEYALGLLASVSIWLCTIITKAKSTIVLNISRLIVLIIGGGAVVPTQASDGYTAAGMLEMKSIRYSRERKDYYYDTLRYGFEVSVIGCQWSMKLGTHDPAVYDSRSISSDGKDTYLLLSYETRRKLHTTPGWNVGDGTVRKGNLPCFEVANEAGAVWLAYASGCHFALGAVTDGRREVPFASYIVPWSLSPGDNLVLERASISVGDRAPCLPQMTAYYIEDLAKEWSRLPKQIHANGPFTNIIYHALSFTNVGGLALPAEATLSICRPNLKLLPQVVSQLCCEIRMVTSNVVLGVPAGSFRPELVGPTVIAEERFNNGTGFNFAYRATNEWPSEKVAAASQAYRGARIDALENGAGRHESSSLVPRILVIGVLASLPLVAWLLSRGMRSGCTNGD
jgi:hypothetical protein